MPTVKVKPEYADRVFGFNNSSAPLGSRDDLHLLLKDAKYHKQKEIIAMFEDLSDEQIKEAQAEQFQNKQKDKSVTAKKEDGKEPDQGDQKPGSSGKAEG